MKKVLTVVLALFMMFALCLPPSSAQANALSHPAQDVTAQSSLVVGSGTVIKADADPDAEMLVRVMYLDDVVTLDEDDPEFGLSAGEYNVTIAEGDNGVAVIAWTTEYPAVQEMLTEVETLDAWGDTALMPGDSLNILAQEIEQGIIEMTFEVYRENGLAGTLSFIIEGEMPTPAPSPAVEEYDDIMRGTVLDVHHIINKLPTLTGEDEVIIRVKETDDGTILEFEIYRDHHAVTTFTMTTGDTESESHTFPISLQSVNHPDRYLTTTADDSAIELLPISGTSDEAEKRRAEFIVMPGLADEDNDGEMVSFMVNDPSHAYVAAVEPGVVTLISPDDIGDYLEEATFNVVDGLAGVGFSFESLVFPEYYLYNSDFILSLDTVDASEFFAEDASFNDVKPLTILKPAMGMLKLVSTAPGDTPDDGSIAMHNDAAVEIVLDASGSMGNWLENSTRIDIAKQTLHELVNEGLPSGIEVAMRVFGGDCESNVAVPFGPLDRDSLNAQIDGMQADGGTPIGASLTALAAEWQEALAAGQVDERSPLLVVLVTDGEETCGGAPLAAIKELSAAMSNVRINIVGYAINSYALKAQFAEWVEAGNGRYFNATDGDELRDAMKQALSVHYAVFDEGGNEVAYGVVDGPAIELEPGDYTVQLLQHDEDDLSVTVGGHEETVIDIER